MLYPRQPEPPPIWICPSGQKLMRTRTIEIVNGERATKRRKPRCCRLASQCQVLPAFGDASSGHWSARTWRFRAVRYGLSRGLLVAIVTPEKTALVRQSFDAIWPVRRKLADQFYRRFFELAPDAQGLFPSDMERQYLKLMDMIAAIVGTLDKREIFQSIISHSGRQHAQFGAKAMHFAAFGDALIWRLELQFGAAFTPQMKEAWIELYDDVQREMMRAGLPGKEGRKVADETEKSAKMVRAANIKPE